MIGTLFRLVPVGLAAYAMTEGREKMTEVGDQVMNVVLEFKAGMEMRGAAKMLRLDLINGQKPPMNSNAFQEYLRRNMEGETDPAFDPWEGLYRLEEREGGLMIVSCGPDTECGNEDDLEAIVKARKGRKKWGSGSSGDRFGVERLRQKFGGGGGGK